MYCIFAICMLPFLAAAVILAPVLAVYSVAANRRRLPGFLQWFSTVDDDLDGGQHQHPDKYPAGATGFRLWWQRTCWIWRNPAQGFQVYAFGYSMSSSYMESQAGGLHWQTDIFILGNGDRIFSHKRQIPIGGRYYIKMWFGWARKTGIIRYSLKFVPFSIGRYN